MYDCNNDNKYDTYGRVKIIIKKNFFVENNNYKTNIYTGALYVLLT